MVITMSLVQLYWDINTGDGIKKWRESVGEDVGNYEGRRAGGRGIALTI